MSENHNVADPTENPAPPPGGKADLGLLLMATIWGANFPVIKASLSQIPPMAFNALRFPLAALAVYLLLRSRGRIPGPRREDWPRIVALGILGNVVYQLFFIFGLDGTLAGNASILLATIPVWTLVLSTLRRHETPGTQVWLGILITLVGMTLVVMGGTSSVGVGESTLRGDLMVVGAAMAWSAYTVGSRRMIRRYGSLPVTAWTLWVGTVALVLMGVPSLQAAPLGEVELTGWFGVAYAGLLAIALAYVLWYRGVQRIGSSRTAAYQNLAPIVALAVAWIWLAEVPGRLQLLGAAVVIAGLTLARLGKERKG